MEELFDLKIKTIDLINDAQVIGGEIDLQRRSGVNCCTYTPSYGNTTPTVHTRTGCTLKTMICPTVIKAEDI